MVYKIVPISSNKKTLNKKKKMCYYVQIEEQLFLSYKILEIRKKNTWNSAKVKTNA